jgi:hypothetical protein
MDIAGPFPETPEGFTYFLLSVDMVDSWVDIYELKKTDAAEVIERLLRGLIAADGVPDVLLSDRASNFSSEFATGVFERLGVKYRQITAPRSPWANGLAEATIKIAKKIMKKLSMELRQHWNKVIWMVIIHIGPTVAEVCNACHQCHVGHFLTYLEFARRQFYFAVEESLIDLDKK